MLPLTLSELSENPQINWTEVQNNLKYNTSNLENLLFKIHLKRKKQSRAISERNILTFLSCAYINTNDIRYYNEFLWFYSDSNPNRILKAACDNQFFKNLNNCNCHCHKFDLSNFQSSLKENASAKNDSFLNGKKIGLIGVPIFFGEIHASLKKRGAEVVQVFIPRHLVKTFKLIIPQ